MRRATVVAVLLSVAACSRRDSSARDSLPRANVRTDSAPVQAPGATTKPDTVVSLSTVFTLSSSAFQNGDSIPRDYTCDGANRSPPLAWPAAPPRTAAYALIVEDPDAPSGTFIHWVLYDLPGGTASLPEGLPKDGILSQLGGARQGRTSFGSVGYGGPCPPRGPAHHYHFRLVALDARLGLPAGATRDEVVAAMHGHELGRAELVGLYARR
jgi:Raf kinase inhibitor-like YbhB/YbcL family protein